VARRAARRSDALSDPAAALADGGVRLERAADRPDVARVILDRPDKRNAQTPATWRALAEIGASLATSVRAVIVSGAGQSFSAGLDLRMLAPDGVPGEPGLVGLAALPGAEIDRAIAEFQRGFSWLSDGSFISVAAVHGHAVGAGFQLALACDLMVVGDDAQLSMRETSFGLVPDLTGTHRLVARVGESRALEICASGRWVGAEEAVRLGIAVSVCGRDELAAAVDELLAPILAAPPAAVVALKGLLSGAGTRTPDEQRAAERAAQVLRLKDLAGTS
jgi:enoyl-CoA hydratase/carnithine racemase